MVVGTALATVFEVQLGLLSDDVDAALAENHYLRATYIGLCEHREFGSSLKQELEYLHVVWRGCSRKIRQLVARNQSFGYGSDGEADKLSKIDLKKQHLSECIHFVYKTLEQAPDVNFK